MRDKKNELRWIPCPICGGRTQIRVYPSRLLLVKACPSGLLCPQQMTLAVNLSCS